MERVADDVSLMGFKSFDSVIRRVIFNDLILGDLLAVTLNSPKRGCFKVDQVKDQGRTSEKKLSWLEVFGSK
jgi:hypothetical protein